MMFYYTAWIQSAERLDTRGRIYKKETGTITVPVFQFVRLRFQASRARVAASSAAFLVRRGRVQSSRWVRCPS